MTNQEIDHKLAKAMGYRIGKSSLDGVIRVFKDESNKVPRYFRPTANMQDAWDVFNHFGFDELYRSLDTWVVMKYGTDTVVNVNASSDESAAKAICLAALKVIENQEV